MDWDAFDELVKLTAAKLREGRGNRAKIRAAIRSYINRGYRLIHSPMILWDYFAISDPGIPRQAGYTEEEIKDAVALFEDLSEAKFGASDGT